MAEIITPKAIEVPPKAVAPTTSDATPPPKRRIAFDGFTKKLEVFFPEGSTLRETHYLWWFNDDGVRITKALQAGYEFVTSKEVAMGEMIVPLNEDLGDRVSRVVGTKADGKAMHCFLMKLPNELREQDEARQAAEVDSVDEVINRGRMGMQGVSEKDANSTYIPKWAGFQYDPKNPEISKRRG